jgi:predicted dehydrogenase
MYPDIRTCVQCSPLNRSAWHCIGLWKIWVCLFWTESGFMEKQTIAIVGLGKMGSAFLAELLGQSNEAVEIVAVAEIADTAGLALAKSRRIRNVSIDQLIAMGEDLDILFDLTGDDQVRQELRDKLQATGNRHTIVAAENIARMVWALIASGAELPVPRANAGY